MNVNTPFLLDDPNKVWFIDSGNISVYTVQMENGEEIGQRYYFFNAKVKEILMGLDSGHSDENIGFSADATEDSVVYELSIDKFKEIAKDPSYQSEVVEVLDEWIENLFYGLSENVNHPQESMDVLVKSGERIILRRDEHISSQKEVIWSRMTLKKDNSVLLNGLNSIPTKEDKKAIVLPLTRRSFLTSTRNTGMKFLSTEEALELEETWEGLRLLDEIIFHLEKEEIALVKEIERQRLKEKYQSQFRLTNEALQETESILHPGAADKYAHAITQDSDDPLFKTCQVIGSQAKIEFIPPPAQDKTIDPLGDIARMSKVRYREVLLQEKWWKHDSGPLLAFLKASNEPIALIPDRKHHYEAYNPETKETFPIDHKTVEKIDKVAYTFFRPFPEKPITVWDVIRFGVLQDSRDLFMLLFMGLSTAVLGLLTPILVGVLFDYVIPNAEKIQIFHIGIALFAASLGYVMFEITENFALLRIETKMDLSLQAALWDRLLNLPASFFRQYNSGDLADRAMGINDIRQILTGVTTTTVLASIFSFLNFILLFYFSTTLALVAIGIIFFELVVIYFLGRWQIQKEREAMKYEGQTQGISLQLLTGITKLRVTGTEIKAFTHWLKSFNKLQKFTFEASQISNTQQLINSLTPIVASIVIFSVVMQQLKTGDSLSTGEFLAFNAAYGSFMSAMLAMSASLLTIFQIFPIYERARPILETMPETDVGKINPGKLRGNIEISQVDFRYETNSPLVLQNISLSLEAGDYVAFVGPSGSGKSTLVRLLLGFEKPETGSVYFDSQELSRLDVRLVRRQVGVVLQEGQLTPGDILSNIIGSSPQLTIDDAWEAAKMAAIDEDIRQMPMGMHTIINEGGSTLSGGQRQRLMIAQTLVHKPNMIIFDEATSALDNQTQAIITESLNKSQATRIVIAHRLSTIKDVDKIFVFDQGKLVQAGSYEELMAVEGLFKELAERQIA